MSVAEPRSPLDPPTTPTSHPKGFFFLFAGEFAERFSFYGMRAILPLYLSDQLGFGEEKGGLYYSLFLGMCYALPLLGGWVADNFLGKYWTIVGFSLPYVLGQFLVGFENPYLLVISLGLLSMGTGVIKPNISTLMGITYDQQRPGQEALRTTAFQAFYMSINIGAFLSQLLVPMIRDTTGSYLYAFLVPAVFMVVALAIFAIGKKHYGTEVIKKVKEPETPAQTVAKLKVLGQVALLFLLVSFFWAVFDQSSYTWVYFAKTYMNRNILGFDLAPDSIQALNPFFIVGLIGGSFLLKMVLPKKANAKVLPATFKMLIGFLLTSVCMGVMAFAAYQVGDPVPAVKVTAGSVELLLPAATKKEKDEKTGEEKEVVDISAELPAGTLDLKAGKLAVPSAVVKLPADSKVKLTTSDVALASAGTIKFKNGQMTFGDGKVLHFKDGGIDWEQSKALLEGDKLTFDGVLEGTIKGGKKIQLSNGVVYTGLGNKLELKAGEQLPKFESKSEDKPSVTVEAGKYLDPSKRVSVWWMALAFFVITIAEVLISVTGLELAFVVAPPSMKGFITACWLLTVAIANWFINAPIAGLYPAMHPGNYFLLLAGAGLLVAALFVPVSRQFNKAMAEVNAKKAADEGKTEVV